MKKFNINNDIYIQITKHGWKHLKKTVGDDYIKNCIKTPAHEKVINSETWYKLICWEVFKLLPNTFGGQLLFKTTIMFDDDLF